MTEQEKRYYNLYLITSRTCRNKPFKIRENFDGFEDKPEYGYLCKVVKFLNEFSQIKPEKYFEAPFKMYADVDYFDLKFFASQKAIKTYTLYMKQRQEESPDSDHHISFIKESLRFIGMFCIKNKISLNDYIRHSGGSTYSWMKHVREHKVSIYSVFEFADMITTVNESPEDERDLLLGSMSKYIYTYKQRYMNSKVAKNVVKEGLIRIRPVIEKGL